MSLNLSSASLRSLVSLTEKREKFLAELADIEAKISAALDGASIGSAKPFRRGGRSVGNTRSAKPTKRNGKRGKIKELILGALKEAGGKGISVRELSTKLGLKNQNVHVWFATTGRKLTEKAGTGIYRLKESSAKSQVPSAIEKPAKTKASVKKSKLTKKIRP